MSGLLSILCPSPPDSQFGLVIVFTLRCYADCSQLNDISSMLERTENTLLSLSFCLNRLNSRTIRLTDKLSSRLVGVLLARLLMIFSLFYEFPVITLPNCSFTTLLPFLNSLIDNGKSASFSSRSLVSSSSISLTTYSFSYSSCQAIIYVLNQSGNFPSLKWQLGMWEVAWSKGPCHSQPFVLFEQYIVRSLIIWNASRFLFKVFSVTFSLQSGQFWVFWLFFGSIHEVIHSRQNEC